MYVCGKGVYQKCDTTHLHYIYTRLPEITFLPTAQDTILLQPGLALIKNTWIHENWKFESLKTALNEHPQEVWISCTRFVNFKKLSLSITSLPASAACDKAPYSCGFSLHCRKMTAWEKESGEPPASEAQQSSRWVILQDKIHQNNTYKKTDTVHTAPSVWGFFAVWKCLRALQNHSLC